MYMVQNTKNDQNSIFLVIFMENVTSMTPFKIGFYIAMVSRVNKKVITLKSFTSYAIAKYDPLATTYRTLAVDFRPKPNFLI